jgi:glycosyltransferase involved in cell wall biosynthesis
MKIIATLAVKNEEWCLEHCLKSLSFVDEIIAVDDDSTDSTLDILKKYNCKIVSFNTKSKLYWREYETRTMLLEKARESLATHIISIDGDESCSELFIKNARDILLKLKPGQSLELEWLNLCSEDTYKKPEIFKSFVFCDDKVSTFTPGFIGISRVPISNEIRPLRISDGNLIFHYQFINREQYIYKQVWYMILDLLKGERSAKRINNMYRHAAEINCEEIKDAKKISKDLPIPNKNLIWQRDDVLQKIKENGILIFEPLNIWHIKELKDKFVKEVGRMPKIQKFPVWIIFINDIKNIIKNKLK